ncbi:hypothetical protein COV93_06145 [Candidatus Woesearchaeota archaeon CG11_big_fil_rev_8_21_14_0_20_43_8]|nr:MAG: hypothetical protein COV93_06145 [Candidatus Woesearchaeota archaeon CG11_big_fil_rev_8_21_14_0_20_43_8]
MLEDITINKIKPDYRLEERVSEKFEGDGIPMMLGLGAGGKGPIKKWKIEYPDNSRYMPKIHEIHYKRNKEGTYERMRIFFNDSVGDFVRRGHKYHQSPEWTVMDNSITQAVLKSVNKNLLQYICERISDDASDMLLGFKANL